MSSASLLAGAARRPATPGILILRRVFSFQTMLGSLLVVLAVLTVRARFDDPDMWWHLKTGQIIWTTHTIPTTDLFSYTTNHHAWVPHEWLAQLSIYAAYRFGGYSGMMLWLCFFSAVLLLAAYAACWLYSGNSKMGWAGAMIVWFGATVGLAIRPQMLGYLLLILELLLLELGRTRSPRWFLGLPPLFAFWVNCHGSFFLGIAIAGILYFCSFFNFQADPLEATRWQPRQRWMLAAALALSIAALWINPVGTQQVLYPLNTMLRQPINLSQVQEWQPLQLNGVRGFGFLAILGSVCLILIARRSLLFWHELLLLAVGAELAIRHDRMMFVFGILAAPVLARMLAPFWSGDKGAPDHPAANALLLAVAGLVVVWAFPSQHSLQQQVEANSPQKAVLFLETHPLGGHMLNDYGYGGYLIWAAPQYPVFLDGRADVFEWTGVLEDFAQWATLKSDPNTLLNKYRIDFCVLNRESPMAHVLPVMQGWKRVYEDNQSVIFARSGATAAAAPAATRPNAWPLSGPGR